MRAPRLLRITTVPQSLVILLNGQLEFMSRQGFEVLTVSSDGPEARVLSSKGIRHQAVAMSRSITPLRDLLSLVRLIITIIRFKPDIVHTHTPKAGLLGMLAAWICGVPVRLHTVAGLPAVEKKGWRRALLFWTERITCRCASLVYTNSNGLRQYMIDVIGINPSRVKTLGNGSSNGIDWKYFTRTPDINLQASSLRAKFGATDHIVICFVGRVVRDKGVVELVEAFKRLSRQDVRLVVVGPFEHDLDPLPGKTLEFLHSDSRVVLPGFQSDIRPWLAASDIFVLPSYREGFPNVVMQAACMELPCIVSDINGCNEIVGHQSGGIVVPVKNVDALRQAIELLAGNQQLRRSYANEARQKVIRDFDQQYLWNLILEEYRTALATRRLAKD